MNNTIVLDEHALGVMEYETDFRTYAREELKMRDPFAVSMDLFAKRCHEKVDENGVRYTEIDPEDSIEEPTRAEKDNYIKARNRYIATRVFQEIGYEAFLREMERNNYQGCLDSLVKQFLPCESADGQCRLDCPKYKGGCANEADC